MSRLPWVLASLVALFSAPGPLGAQVSLPSTGAGVVAEPSGRFVISGVPAGTHRLRINVLGYRPLDRPVNVVAGEVTEVSLGLESAAVVLKGLVVTALGIERRARTLGVATQHIDDTRLGPIAPNVVASLSGRVPGVSITNATTQGGSSRIVIRGESSLLGNNQPLFVVDGIPVDNYIGVRQGVLADQGGYDYGTLINDLDLGSIESVTVLKGPNASSLYGSRASNGAILVDTRKGIGALGGADIVVSQTVTWEDELRLPKYQSEYGQGNQGIFEYYDGDGNGRFDERDESWGPPLDVGLMIPQFHSPVTGVDANGRAILEPLPWVSHPDNIDQFYERGTVVTSVSVASASDRMNGRMGYTRFGQNGMVPGNRLDRSTLSLAGGMTATDWLRLDTSLQYTTQGGLNRPAQGYDPNNPQGQIGVWFGRQVDMELLRRNYLERFPDGHPAAGTPYNWQRHYWNNPYYLQLANGNEDERNRLFGQVSASFQLMPWLAGMARTATDWYEDDRLKAWAEDNCCMYSTNPLTGGREPVQGTGAFARVGPGLSGDELHGLPVPGDAGPGLSRFDLRQLRRKPT